jgi:hypothetical protein
MDGRPPGDRSIDPGELLRSALEKIVFFECRVAQLEAELAAARQVAERARADAAEARTQETEARQALAAEREARAGLSLREAEAAERVRLLEAERERLMAGLVDRARVAGATGTGGEPGPEEGGADLAGFIAELRAEIESLRGWKAAAEAAGAVVAGLDAAARPARPAPASVGALAGSFQADGRTGLAAGDAGRLKALLTTRADQVLYERSMAELSDPDAALRRRAVRQLEALGARAAAPLLAAALGREPEPSVKVLLLEALARFQEPFAAGLAVRELEDGRAEVRAAALETLAAVAEAEALPHLARALGDRSPIVRRRAAVLLGFARGERAEEALVAALRDADQGVARAAAAALSGRTTETARRALARHQVAARAPAAAAAHLAPAAQPAADPPSPAALRIGAQLASGGARQPSPLAPAAAPAPARAATAPVPAAPSSALAPRARTAVAVVEEPAPRPAPVDPSGDALEAAVELELRGALRGRTAAELCAATGAPAARVDAALEALRARGTLTLRGSRWCVT